MDNNVTTLLHIPWTDVLYKNILPQLSIRDLFNLRSMSKSYKNMIDSYFVICPELNLAINSRINKCGFNVLFERCRKIKHLNLARCNSITDDILAEFVARNKYIVDINNLSYCTNVNRKVMYFLITNCRELTSLYLDSCKWITSGITYIMLTYPPRNLQIVDFTNCQNLSKQCIIEFLIRLNKLKTLSLAFIPSLVTNVTMVAIGLYCAELEYLNIDGCYLVTDMDFVISKCTKLKSIKVKGEIRLRENFNGNN